VFLFPHTRKEVKNVLYRTDFLQQSCTAHICEPEVHAKAFAKKRASSVLVRGRTAEPFAGKPYRTKSPPGRFAPAGPTRPHDTINIARATIAQEVRRVLVINSLGTLEGNFDHG